MSAWEHRQPKTLMHARESVLESSTWWRSCRARLDGVVQVVCHRHDRALRERELRLAVRQRGGAVQVHGRAGVQHNVAYGAHLHTSTRYQREKSLWIVLLAW